MAKKLNQNVYVHGDPETGEGAGWYGPDYPDAKVTDKIAKQIGDHAFADEDANADEQETPGAGATRQDLERQKVLDASRKKLADDDLVGAPPAKQGS